MLNRKWLLSLSAILITGGFGAGVYHAVQPMSAKNFSPEALEITSYRSPTCGCCQSWVEHLKAEGFTVKDNVTENLNAIKSQNNVPQDLMACHTAVINGYVVEGLIPIKTQCCWNCSAWNSHWITRDGIWRYQTAL